MLEDLIERIDELGGQDAYPVVPLRLFFEGNDDPASFAPNLDPHPGVATIYSTLLAIAERPCVSDIVVQVDEVLDPPEWPYATSVYVITSAEAAEVHDWAAAIGPDGPSVDPRDNYGWGAYTHRDPSAPPPGAPAVPAGYRPVVLYWD